MRDVVDEDIRFRRLKNAPATSAPGTLSPSMAAQQARQLWESKADFSHCGHLLLKDLDCTTVERYFIGRV